MADRNRVRCTCPRCTIRGLMGPAIIVTIGILLLLGETRGGYFDFGNTWPVILLVVGGVSLASALAPMTGHVVAPPAAPFVPPGPPIAPAPPPPPVGTPGSGAWQPPDSGRGQ
jgi:hypothetical protein